MAAGWGAVTWVEFIMDYANLHGLNPPGTTAMLSALVLHWGGDRRVGPSASAVIGLNSARVFNLLGEKLKFPFLFM